MRYFLDNCLSPKFAPMLREMGQDVVALREQFPPDAKDVDWIPLVGKNGWVLVSVDHNIRKHPQERDAMVANHLRAFFLSKSFLTLTLWKQASRLFECWPDIEKAARQTKPGATFLVQLNGKLELL